MLYLTTIDESITDELVEKLSKLRQKNEGLAYDPTHHTINGFQTHNLCNDISLQPILKNILSYLPYSNTFEYRWFHMIDYDKHGFQQAHDHSKTEDYTFILYLSTCKEGGETSFNLSHELKIKPIKNTIIFFSSNIMHSGNITVDNKKVAVGALVGRFI